MTSKYRRDRENRFNFFFCFFEKKINIFSFLFDNFYPPGPPYNNLFFSPLKSNDNNFEQKRKEKKRKEKKE